ncbi:response regulator receiver and ANTAR domain protein [Cognatiyoonia koreensis]|uniref:Response regulator receiver and ANTAR domain protein n=2 Tax=Cognatiyoonia koreensis TaxID=364200 RepID=A0A1I0MYS8_9RHOB|nr:response regulator receiver and ANTAR domain protein [Cognatiyoonia koreensis]
MPRGQAVDVPAAGTNEGVMNRDLRILVVEPDPERVQDIITALSDAGWSDVRALAQISGLERTVREFIPDIVLIDLANPDRDTLEHISYATESTKRAVALFVDQTDDNLTQSALNAGVSAYVVDGLKMERIKSVLETAIARFKVMRQMKSELDAAKQALEDRKTIDRAKGILMRQRNMSEDDAYTLLRKTAMGQNRKVIDVAQALVTAADLLS